MRHIPTQQNRVMQNHATTCEEDISNVRLTRLARHDCIRILADGDESFLSFTPNPGYVQHYDSSYTPMLFDDFLINSRLSRNSTCRSKCDIDKKMVGTSLCPVIADTASMPRSRKQLGVPLHDSTALQSQSHQQRPRSPTIHHYGGLASNIKTLKVEGLGPIIISSTIFTSSTNQSLLTITKEDNVRVNDKARPLRCKTSPRRESKRPVSPEAIRFVSNLPRKIEYR